MTKRAGLDFEAVFDAAPTPYLILTPDLLVVAVNRAYEQVTGTPRAQVVGKPMFEAFPDDDGPEDSSQASGAVQLRASFERVLRTGQPDAMSLLRYAVADQDGTFSVHWWSPLNAPVLDESGQVVMLLHRAEKVTDYYLRRQQQLEHQDSDQGQGQVSTPQVWDAAEADLYARGGELRQALDREHTAAERLARLVDVSVRLAATTSIADLIDVVIHHGLAVLGAEGGAIAVASADQRGWDLVLSGTLGAEAEQLYSYIPADSTLPVAAAARTGQVVLLRGAQECLDFSAENADALRTTGLTTWLSVPLLAGDRALGAITAGWRGTRDFSDRDLDVVRGLVAQCALALQRLQARDAERLAAEAEHQAAATARLAAQRQGALVGVARSLGDADSEGDVLGVIAEHGARLLPTAVWGLGLLEDGDGGAGVGATVRVLGTADIDQDVRAQVQQVPADFAIPVVDSAVRGTAHFLADREQTSAAFTAAGELYAAAGLQASASVPLRARGHLLGSLSVALGQPHPWSGGERDLLEAFAGLTAQALERIAARAAERAAEAAATAAAAGIAQTLQRSMLTAPPEPDHLQIAVRYAATAKTAEVGGDWYDAFVTSGGLTSLVIGDVTGHDMAAAAKMGQLRNLVRGIAFTLGEPPAAVLAAVDRAAAGLGIDTVATAVLAQVEQDDAHRAAGTRLLRWSNAGHLPPLLITAEGAASYLEHDSDLVLGWDPSIDRHDHEHVLAPGSTVLLFTDGLVERRGVSLERGLEWLAQAAGELASSPRTTLEELCDGLLELVGEHLDDDVALLALRAHPEDAPRPAEAGPVRVPTGLEDARAAAAPDPQT